MEYQEPTTANEGPFGYSFFNQADPSLGTAPAPATGPKLISPDESQYVDQFLHNVASLHPIDDDQLMDPFIGYKDEGGSSFWTSRLPRTYEGSVTWLPSSSTHATGPDYHVSFPNDRSLPTNAYPTTGTLPAYVSPAATVYSGQPLQQQMPQEATFAVSQPALANGHHQLHYEHASATHVPMNSNTWSSSSGLTPVINPSISYSSLHSNHARQMPPTSEAQNELSWGSDPGFDDSHFIAPACQPTEESITTNALNQFGCLETQGSVDTTRASSPLVNGEDRRHTSESTDLNISAAEVLHNKDITWLSPKSSKPSTTQAEEEFLLQESPSPPAKKRKASPAKKRGRPRANGADKEAATRGQISRKKSDRVKLTEDEKRENHVNSEQKRRDGVNKEWDNLRDFVPGIEDHNLAKSGQVNYATRWLRQVLGDIERMEDLLQATTT
ncbi:MAG: hypothetical protein Q9225_001820 [Loekoesia sp. 1 TL-2023]